MRNQIALNGRYTLLTSFGAITGVVVHLEDESDGSRVYSLEGVKIRSSVNVDEITFLRIDDRHIVALSPAIDPPN